MAIGLDVIRRTTVTTYSIWKKKPEFLGPSIVLATLYTLYGDEPVEREQWEFLGPSAEPNKYIVRDVREKGFCLRELTTKDQEMAKMLYGSSAA